MPGRATVLATGEVYHIFNRGVASQPTFLDRRDYQRALATLLYYQFINLPFKYSRFVILAQEERVKLLNQLKTQNQRWIDVVSYCLMPNHFHLLVKQIKHNGIPIFVGNFSNSYTRYSNTKRERDGPLFRGRFASVRIESEEQLFHVHRYIHLNPYTAYISKSLKELEDYPYSSLAEYLGKSNLNLCHKEIILSGFKNISSYKQFILDQADYQRTLGDIKHLCLEK